MLKILQTTERKKKKKKKKKKKHPRKADRDDQA